MAVALLGLDPGDTILPVSGRELNDTDRISQTTLGLYSGKARDSVLRVQRGRRVFVVPVYVN